MDSEDLRKRCTPGAGGDGDGGGTWPGAAQLGNYLHFFPITHAAAFRRRTLLSPPMSRPPFARFDLNGAKSGSFARAKNPVPAVAFNVKLVETYAVRE